MKIEIRKYANRKHYDVESGRYVSMLEIGDLAAGGRTLEVLDDRTGRDVTLETMARALYERLRARRDPGEISFPPARLARLFPLVRR